MNVAPSTLRRLPWLIVLACAAEIDAAAPPKAPVPQSPYIAVVYRYADTMLEKGRDTFGPIKTGLFLSALDRATLAPLTNRPPAPRGVSEQERVGALERPLIGANLQHDENLLRLLYLLTDLTTKPKYRDAAAGALKWFFENAAVSNAWGGRGFWDVLADQAVVMPGENDEFLRPWLLGDRAFASAPQACQSWSLQLKSRLPPLDVNAARSVGFLLRTWASAYAATKDHRYIKAAEDLSRKYTTLGRPYQKQTAQSDSFPRPKTTAALSLAIDCDGAALLVPTALGTTLHAWAGVQDAIALADERKEAAAGSWTAGPGEETRAQVALMLVSRYENANQVNFRSRFLATADTYLNSLPSDQDDVWPGTLGQAISLELAAWRHTANPEYLARARVFGDLAISKFFGTNPLPRASLRSEHYESITGAGTLALALAELHLQVLHITAVRCPPNTIDR